MATESTETQVQQANEQKELPAWVNALLNIFKKLLDTSNFSYGTKKDF